MLVSVVLNVVTVREGAFDDFKKHTVSFRMLLPSSSGGVIHVA